MGFDIQTFLTFHKKRDHTNQNTVAWSWMKVSPPSAAEVRIFRRNKAYVMADSAPAHWVQVIMYNCSNGVSINNLLYGSQINWHQDQAYVLNHVRDSCYVAVTLVFSRPRLRCTNLTGPLWFHLSLSHHFAIIVTSVTVQLPDTLISPTNMTAGSLLVPKNSKANFLIVRFVGPTWGPSGADRTQVGPMLVPRTLLSGLRGSIRALWLSDLASIWQTVCSP